MDRYNYLEQVKADVKEWINDHDITVNKDNREEAEQSLNEELWIADSVTGNGSGSYTFNRWQAEENLCHNMELLGEALSEFGCDTSELKRGAEFCDVTIRCYLLGQAIREVLDEICEEQE